MIFRSLRSRLFLTYLLIIGLVLGLIGLGLVLFLLSNPLQQQLVYRQLEFSMNALTRREGRALVALRADDQVAAVARLDELIGARVVLVGPTGEVIADSQRDEDPLPPGALKVISANKDAFRGQFRDSLASSWLYLSQMVSDRHWLVVATPRPTLRTLALWGDDLLIPVFRAGGVALVLAALMAWLISRWVSAPLRRMAEASNAVAEGDYGEPIQLVGPDEVQSLANAFNEMVDQVQTSQQSQRDFVANVSHELKTPLTSIQGFAQAILDGAASDRTAQRRAAQVIFDESDRLHRLVDDLLDLARLDAGQVDFDRNPLDLSVLLRAVVERLSVKARDHKVHIVNRVPELPELVGDGDRLAQVFTNILDNAIKHSQEDDTVTLWGSVEGGWVSIHVDDSGPGIPVEDLSRIFERFYQLDKARPGGRGRGVGLGLAISREIVRTHGGRLVAQSAVGKGSRFTVQLPIIRHDDKTLARNPD